jgi:hypothetical protein
MDNLGADYTRWIKADSWSVERAILLLINSEILPKQNDIYDCGSPRTTREQSVYNQFMEIWPILESSLKYGSLKKLDKGCVGLWNDVSPKDFIHWAKLKGYLLPDELKAIGTGTQAEVDDDVDVKQTKNQQRDEDFKRWIEEINPDIDDMTKADIQAALIPRNRTLWTSGFNDWVKYTALYAGRRGRKLN